jgi:uncharacterized protein YaiL (DUF2058 family)
LLFDSLITKNRRQQAATIRGQAEEIAGLQESVRQLEGRWRFLAGNFARRFVRDELVKKIFVENPQRSDVIAASDGVLEQFSTAFVEEFELYTPGPPLRKSRQC